jgi:hypothetical protein
MDQMMSKAHEYHHQHLSGDDGMNEYGIHWFCLGFGWDQIGWELGQIGLNSNTIAMLFVTLMFKD